MAVEKSRDWYDKRQHYLEERRANVLPLIDRALAAERYAVDFSLLTIKTGALLNGGALIALPAFGAFFKLSLYTASQGLFHGGVALTIGLLLSWLAMVASYFTNLHISKQSFALSTFTEYRASIALSNAIGEGADKVPDNTAEHWSRSERAEKRARWSHIAALILTLLSLVFFVLGVYLGGTALIQGSSHVGHT